MVNQQNDKSTIDENTSNGGLGFGFTRWSNCKMKVLKL
jgi:hypothetical protein